MENESLRNRDEKPRLSTAKQIFLYSAPFPALTFFAIWASMGGGSGRLLMAACAMLLYCVCCLTLALRWDKPTYFDWTACAYFLTVALAVVFWPTGSAPIVTEFAVTGVYLCLFVATFFPPVIGLDPFTYHYAKKYAPKAVWKTPIFVTINRIMTFAWAGIFAICVILSLWPSVVFRALIPIALIVGVGIPFNLGFPRDYLKRLGLPFPAQAPKSGRSNSSETVSTAGSHGAPPLATAPPQPTSEPFLKELPSRQTGPANAALLPKESTMKVLALNSSPRSHGTSKTGMLLDALVQGMSDAGAAVETVHLRKKTVKNCIGCYTCWTKTPGICVHKDDMTNELFPKWLDADMVVYATPLYHFTVNATMKAFIERTLPVLEPFLVTGAERTTHPLRHTPPKAVVLSVAGFPEPTVFAQLSSYVRFLFNKGLVAEIYRPAAEIMSVPEWSEVTKEILEATTQAGRELIQSAAISAQTNERITQPIGGDFDSMAAMANLFWKSCIREGCTPAEFYRKNLVPRPDSLETFMMIMSSGFNAGAAANTTAVLQFAFTGEVEGTCHFRIDKGTIEPSAGAADKPDLVIESPFDVWMDVITGKANGQEMFMQQKYKSVGDLSLLIRMNELFGRKEG